MVRVQSWAPAGRPVGGDGSPERAILLDPLAPPWSHPSSSPPWSPHSPPPLPSLSPTCSPREPVNTRVRPLAQSPPVVPPHSGEKLSLPVARPTRPAPSLLCSHLSLSLTLASKPQGLALAVPSVGNTLPQYPHTWSPPSLPSQSLVTPFLNTPRKGVPIPHCPSITFHSMFNFWKFCCSVLCLLVQCLKPPSLDFHAPGQVSPAQFPGIPLPCLSHAQHTVCAQ